MDRLAANLSPLGSTQKTPVEYPIPRAISIRPDDFPAPLQDRVNENIILVVRGLARPARAANDLAIRRSVSSTFHPSSLRAASGPSFRQLHSPRRRLAELLSSV